MANKKLSELGTINTLPVNAFIHITDPTDETQSISGSDFKINANLFLSQTFRNSVDLSSTKPTLAGVYPATQGGTYTGWLDKDGVSIVLDPNKINYIILGTDGFFSVQANAIDVSNKIDKSDVKSEIIYSDLVNPVNGKAVSDFLTDSLNITVKSKNLFDKSVALIGKYVNTGNGTLSTVEGFFTSDFIKIENLKDYIIQPSFTFIAFYTDANEGSFINGSGIGEAGQTTINPPLTANYLRFSGSFDINLYQLEEGLVQTSFEPFYTVSSAKFEEKSLYVDKYIVTEGDNYNLIRRMVNSITDASETKRYRVHVPRGRWQECDLTGKPFVQIIGDDFFDTVIYNDGLSTKNTPSDYSSIAYANTPLNEVPQLYKHVVYVTADTDIQNLTIEAVQEIKYCAHIDATTYKNVIMKCRFNRVGEGVNNCVGIGSHSGQFIDLSESVFIRTDNQPAVFYHNSTAQTKGTFLYIDNSFFEGCSPVLIDELGSNQEDWIYIRNSDCNNDANKKITVIVEVDPVGLAYNIKMNIVGTKITSVYQIPYMGDANPRPNIQGYIIGKIGG